MLRRYFSLCSRCRRVFEPLQYGERRLHASAAVWRGALQTQRRGKENRKENHRSFYNPQKKYPVVHPNKKYTTQSARDELNGELGRWARSKSIQKRLWAMGVRPSTDGESYASTLLQNFVKRAPQDGYFTPADDESSNMEGVVDLMSENRRFAIDRTWTRRFLTWAVNTKGLVPPHIIHRISSVLKATDLTYPAEWYPHARSFHRKIILHVGPTNSGKTHHALRALAGARNGVYAGPLRLLAHEIFHRFNTGQILPPGADPNDPPEKHIRPCNLLTGEEQKFVSDDAMLTSCTVEMLKYSSYYEVAVVDEIQMMADLNRGGAWTAAVLGLAAKELHLCGEESVIPLIQELAKDTQDEVVINRYERLTPLVVAASSLGNDLSKVQKGDCVVTFSRSGIFAIKQEIESKTGLRCALAYGRLPPEVRNEQAAKFNDPDSGYDVLVGSDAIGMGLNLKIKRVVFESSHKYDGQQETPLSLSQIKQIGGRAGRYGLHDDPSPGIVTCLKDKDMEAIRRAFSTIGTNYIKRAVLPMPLESMYSVQQAIPQPSTFVDIFDIMNHVSALGPKYTISDTDTLHNGARYIDGVCPDLSLSEKHMLLGAPIQWRDSFNVDAMVRILKLYHSDLSVGLGQSLRGLGLIEVLETVTRLRKANEPPQASMETLRELESLHKLVVCYLWLHYRAPITFAHKPEAQALKKQTEDAIDYCLAGIVAKRIQKKKAPAVADSALRAKDRNTLLQLLDPPSQSLSYRSSA